MVTFVCLGEYVYVLLNFIDPLLDYLDGPKVIVILWHSAAFDMYKLPGSARRVHLQ